MYVFANECPPNVKEDDWKACLGRVCKGHNTLYTSVRGVKTSDALFRMSKDKPNQYECDGLLTNSFLFVRVAKSNSAVGSCMYSFRAFELNKVSDDPLYSMLYTGNFVFDEEVKKTLTSIKEENGDYSLVYYDNTGENDTTAAAEEVFEQDTNNMLALTV